MEFREVVETRRTVHHYTDEQIDEDTLETLFDLVKYTPTGYNLQPHEFLVLRDEGDKERLQECAFGQEHVTDASAAVVVLGNTDPAAHADRIFDDWLDKEYIPNDEVRDSLRSTVEQMSNRSHEENRVWTTRSTSLAAMTLMYAAWNFGIASCPMEGFDPEAIRSTFDIGDGYEPVMLITLGYPKEDSSDITNSRKLRRSPEEIVHYGEFDPIDETEK